MSRGYWPFLAAIILVCLGVLFLPSSKERRHTKIIQNLDRNYLKGNPDKIRQLKAGHFVTSNNNFAPINDKEAAYIVVWAPFSGWPNSTQGIQILTNPTWVNNRPQKAKISLFVAPNRRSPGWTLLGKLLLASYDRKKGYGDISPLCNLLNANPRQAMKEMELAYQKFPEDVRSQVERNLEENLKIFDQYQETGLLLQTGNGTYYQISDLTPERSAGIASDALPFREP